MVMVFALAAALLYGSADFLGGAAALRALYGSSASSPACRMATPRRPTLPWMRLATQ